MLDKTKVSSRKLEAKGDDFITVCLILVAIGLVIVALTNKNTVFKALVLAWVLLP